MSMFLLIEEGSMVHTINLAETTRVTVKDKLVTVVYKAEAESCRCRDHFKLTDVEALDLRRTLRKLGVKYP